MPWGKKTENGKTCVYKKDTGEVLHCYSGKGADGSADRYIAALYANAGEDAKEVGDGIFMKEDADGRWQITAVSTAAFKDLSGETFTTQAMDYEIKEVADGNQDYPEFRMFHKAALRIGRVEKMYRVGPFAVDVGHSYTDPFSLAVCKDLLAKNTNGKWRISRGFYVLEAAGNCPSCGNDLVVTKQHMIAGFRCPVCKSVHMSYKGTLKEMRFLKTKTFDVTITDRPCVPYTGVTASKSNILLEANIMTKAELKEKLLAAGMSAEAVDARLDTVSDVALKELADIPDAQVLKEFMGTEEEDAENKEEQVMVLDESVLKEVRAIVADEVQKALGSLEIEVDDNSDAVAKEVSPILEAIAELKELLTAAGITTKKEAAPSRGGLRITRLKAAKPTAAAADEEDTEETADEENAEDAQDTVPGKKKMPMMRKKETIMGANGFVASSMTEFVTRPE